MQWKLSGLGHDLRLAGRSLRRAPGFSVAAMLTLGLGVGATLAIFSAINEVVLRPLPYANADRLAVLWESNSQRGWHQVEAAPANIEDWRARSQTLSDIAFVSPFLQNLALLSGSGAVPVNVAQVSGNLFEVLGVSPSLGRLFADAETFTPNIAVISHVTWITHFGGDPAILSRPVQLDGSSYQVIGVLRDDFVYPLGSADMWITPAAMAGNRGTVWWRRAHVFRPIGRLAPDATFAQASQELTGISAALAQEFPATNIGMEAGLTPLQTYLAGDRARTLWLLFGAVGLLMLIACANVANLMLGRAADRQQELAVRAALGASRARLMSQALLESLVLSAGGTALGCLLAIAGLTVIAGMAPPELGGLTARLDWRITGFTCILCICSALVSGLLPAWRYGRDGRLHTLGDGSRATTVGHHRLTATHLLIAAEVGIAVLLVAAAGLLLRSLDQLRRIDPGVDPRGVLTFQLNPPRGVFPTDAARARFSFDLADQLRTLPGVTEVGISRGLPLTGYAWSSDFTIDGWSADRFGVDVRHREATGEYFSALRVPILDGRNFTADDDRLNAAVPVVVNQAFAARYFPNESPVGRRVAFDREPTARSYWYEIVGVVGNERKDILTEPQPEIISHIRGDTPATLTFVMRASGDPLALVPQVRAALDAVNPNLPLLDLRSMAQVVSASRVKERFLFALFGAFAFSALVLAAVGVAGVSHQAARVRVREVGIRLALGASAGAVVRTLVRRGLIFQLGGLSAGLVLALAAGRMLASELFQVDPQDPLTMAATAVLIGSVALLATLWPIWRATRIDPASIIRT